MQSDAKDIGGFDRDILERHVPEEVLAVLLKDHSTGHNLIWATNGYVAQECNAARVTSVVDDLV